MLMMNVMVMMMTMLAMVIVGTIAMIIKVNQIRVDISDDHFDDVDNGGDNSF